MTSPRLPWSKHVRPCLADLEAYDVVPTPARARMAANECPEPWPGEVMEAVVEVVRRIELNRYPDTSARSLRRVLGELHACDPDRIVLGNGSDEVISFLVTTLSGPLERPATVVIPSPTFVMYEHSARVLGLGVRKVPLDGNLQLDEVAMRAALRDAPALCFLARPNNPTGSLWDGVLVERLVEEHPSTVFVVDEAYVAYAPGLSLWHHDRPDNWVHMATLSKVAMAGLRIGYAITHPELARALNKVRHPYNISQTSIAIAETILTRFRDVQAHMIERTIVQRERLRQLLSSISGARVYPSHGNLVLVRLDPPERARELATQLAEQGIFVKDVSATPILEGCLRISVGTRGELDLFEDALAFRS